MSPIGPAQPRMSSEPAAFELPASVAAATVPGRTLMPSPPPLAAVLDALAPAAAALKSADGAFDALFATLQPDGADGGDGAAAPFLALRGFEKGRVCDALVTGLEKAGDDVVLARM